MKKRQPRRTKWLTVRMTPEEYKQLENLAGETTDSSISEYSRKVLLGKPVVKKYRNQSLDDFLTEMLRLRQDLNQIGNSFNQSVRRMHTLERLPEIQQWVLHNEQDKTLLFRQIEIIIKKTTESYRLWSQE